MTVPGLSPVEEQIVLRLAEGQSRGEIACELNVSTSTVEWHIARARRKLERAATLRDCIRAATEPPDSQSPRRSS